MYSHRLRLSVSADKHEIGIHLFSQGALVCSTSAPFTFTLQDGDEQDLSWYFEEYERRQHDPVGKIAKRIEKRISEIGIDIFNQVFGSADSTLYLWKRVLQDLSQTRIEIITDTRDVEIIPWELMREISDAKPL